MYDQYAMWAEHLELAYVQNMSKNRGQAMDGSGVQPEEDHVIDCNRVQP